MFYRMYLSSVCNRRQWPHPRYEPRRMSNGYSCKVLVNNREYSTDCAYETEELARDAAAMKAFMICRNFSNNDGMMPGQRPGQSSSPSGVVQGLPVAIGSGRRANSNRNSASSYESESSSDGSTASSSSSSDDTSPVASETVSFDRQIRHASRAVPKPVSSSSPHPQRRHNHHHHQQQRHVAQQDEYMCLCRRAPVLSYGRCAWCLRESGWA